MRTGFILAAVMAALIFGAAEARADSIFSSSAVVSSADRSATFDSLTSNGINLSTYSEDMLYVTVPDTSYQGFLALGSADGRRTAFHYGAGGNNEYVTIAGTDGAAFTALDFVLGQGQTAGAISLRWETYLDGVMNGSGAETSLALGGVVGWTNAAGFDELRVAAWAASSGPSPGFGNGQAIALDDVRVQVGSPVPEPGSIALLGLGLAGLGFASRRRKARAS